MRKRLGPNKTKLVTYGHSSAQNLLIFWGKITVCTYISLADLPGEIVQRGKCLKKLARLEGETSNALFDTLAEWNDHLKPSDLKGNDGPKP